MIVRKIKVGTQFFLEAFSGKVMNRHRCIENKLPADTRVVGATLSVDGTYIEVLVTSETFTQQDTMDLVPMFQSLHCECELNTKVEGG